MRRLSTSTLFGIAVLQALLLAWGVWSLTNAPAMAPDGIAQRGALEDRAPAAAVQRAASRSTPAPAPVDGTPLDTDVRSATRPTLDPEGPVGIILTGVVRRTTGEPLPGAQVQVFPAVEDVDWNAIRWARQEGDAGFAIMGLRPGRWKVQASAEGHLGDQRELEFEIGAARRHVEFTLHEQPTATLTVLDESGQAYVPGHADLGLPETYKSWLRWPRVLISRELPGPRIDADTLSIGQSGRFLVDAEVAPAWGRLETGAALPLQVSVVVGSNAVATVEWTTAGQELTLTLPRARLREMVFAPVIEVVDAASGRPVVGAEVWVSPRFDDMEFRSDADGRVELPMQPRRMMTVSASDEGRSTGERLVDLAPGDPETVRLELYPTRRISGTLVDANGTPITGGQVRAVPVADLEDATVAGPWWGGYQGTRDGAFEVVVPARPVLLWFRVMPSERHLAGAVARVVDPSGGPIEGLEFQLPPSRILRLVEPGPRLLILRGADGLPISWWEPYHVADKIPVPEGTWTLETWHAGELLDRRTIRIPGDDSTPLELR